jgi:hypothetical protein
LAISGDQTIFLRILSHMMHVNSAISRQCSDWADG